MDDRYWIKHEAPEWLVIDERTGDVVASYPSEAGAQEHCDTLNEEDREDGHREPDYGAVSSREAYEQAWHDKRRNG